MKFYKRILCVAVAASLFALSACGNGENQGGGADGSSGVSSITGDKAMGRYVEQVVSFPENLKLVTDFSRMADGTLQVLGSESDSSIVGPWLLYVSSDIGESWTNKDIPTLSQLDNATILATAYDKEGNLYIAETTYTPEFEERLMETALAGGFIPQEEYPPYILHKLGTDGGLSEIPITWRKEADGSIIINDIAITEAGDLVVSHSGTSVQYDLSTGESKQEFLNTERWGQFLTAADILYVGSENGVAQYNLESGDQMEVIPLGENIGYIDLSLSADGNSIIRCDRSGIYRYVLDGSVWEKVVDGSLTSLTMPSTSVNSIIEQNEDFLVLAYDSEAYTLLKYSYEKDMPVVPDQEMVIYVLEDNETVRQSAGLVQRKYPEIKMTVQTALDSESAVTASDAIRSLNTELLAGKGPDVLLLDGLPVRSYIEKGVLNDLNPALQTMLSSGELAENVVKTYEQDGNLFAVPARFGVPILWAPKEGLDTIRDLTTFADWIVTDHAEHPAVRPLYRMSPEELITDFSVTCAPAWVDESRKARTDALRSFLSDIKRITDTVVEPDLSLWGSYADMVDFTQPFDHQMGSMFWLNNVIRAENFVSFNPEELAFNAVVAGSIEGGYAPMPGQVQNVFQPKVILGVNANSKLKEQAQELIAMALTQSVQNHQFGDGYAVNLKSLDKNLEDPLPEGDDGWWAFQFDSEGMKPFQILWPEASYMSSVKEKMMSLDTPSSPDPVLIQMIIDGSRDYFTGSKELDATVSAVAEQIQAYLSE